MKPKNPRGPRSPLTADPSDFIPYSGPLFTIYRTKGKYRRKWNELRHDGPIDGCRWEPHPEPRGHHSDAGVLYAGTDITTALAEVFQRTRSITLSDQRALAGWLPTTSLTLLDLTNEQAHTGKTNWALRNGASASLDSAPRSTCCAWARAIAATWPDLEGLYVRSTLTGSPMVVLFALAAYSFPADPRFSRTLDDPVLSSLITKAADDLGSWPIRKV